MSRTPYDGDLYSPPWRTHWIDCPCDSDPDCDACNGTGSIPLEDN